MSNMKYVMYSEASIKKGTVLNCLHFQREHLTFILSFYFIFFIIFINFFLLFLLFLLTFILVYLCFNENKDKHEYSGPSL